MKYRMPAEWESHAACWVAWPSAADLWGEDLRTVQDEFVGLCRGIAHAPAGGRAEKINILVPTAKRRKEAQDRLSGIEAEYFDIDFGDIWLRDTAPIFVRQVQGPLVAACFHFNGWGDKYDLPHDSDVAARVAEAFGGPSLLENWILEGGSIEVDGEGTCLTTEQCLLNPNRNPEFSRAQIESRLADIFGVRKTLWLKEGLINDHTDGHIDTLARFVAPGEVVCMSPFGSDDPNAAVLDSIAAQLETMTDAQGRKLKVHRIPSPGRFENRDGEIQAASHVNFYIANHSVVVPTYGTASANAAVEGLAKLFPGRKVIGSSAKSILSGGGAFHCITQQQPLDKEVR